MNTEYNIIRCNRCKNLHGQGACMDNPYPEFTCTKGCWDGITSIDDLFIEVDCPDFEQEEG